MPFSRALENDGNEAPETWIELRNLDTAEFIFLGSSGSKPRYARAGCVDHRCSTVWEMAYHSSSQKSIVSGNLAEWTLPREYRQ